MKEIETQAGTVTTWVNIRTLSDDDLARFGCDAASVGAMNHVENVMAEMNRRDALKSIGSNCPSASGLAVHADKRQKEINDLVLRAVGQTERDCRAAVTGRGFTLRVTRRDNGLEIAECDYRTDRVNVRIDNGIVVEAWLG